MGLVSEVIRRNLLPVALLYVLTSGVAILLTDGLVDSLALPEWVFGVTLVLLALGLPGTMVIQWIRPIIPVGASPQRTRFVFAPIAAILGLAAVTISPGKPALALLFVAILAYCFQGLHKRYKLTIGLFIAAAVLAWLPIDFATRALVGTTHTFRGLYVVSFEVSSFVPCGGGVPGYGRGYWLEFAEDSAWEKYREVGTGVVYVEFEGTVSGSGNYGHLGLYIRRITATNVLEMTPASFCPD